ncbi:DUF4012 domain-containing protein [Candidatus Woesebacteria bacterium]|nr:DUF4012 domain-containing protein [Candidatus Woesebacteria bacterium]
MAENTSNNPRIDNDFFAAWKKNAADRTEANGSSPVALLSRAQSQKRLERKTSKKASPKTSSGRKWWQRRAARVAGIALVVILLLGAIFGVIGFWGYQKAMAIQAAALEAKAEAHLTYAAFKTQNLPQAREHLTKVQSHVYQVQELYGDLGWAKYVPVAKAYYEDGEHALVAAVAGTNAGLKGIDAIEPHADLLGFEGEGTFSGTTEDRLGVVLETLNQITPELDAIAAEIEIVQENLAAIDPERYPENVRGYEVRSLITQAQDYALAAEVALNEARPAVERLPEVAGAEERRKYLVIFQNDNELRPTGGFMTAYAVVYVEDAKVTPEKSDDIYELDQKFRNKPPIPEELGRFLITENTWNLRDMNIDPNFKNSMETFYEYYQEVPGEPDDIDGIIAVDTVVLEKIVEIIGPVEVPGYGTFSAQNLEICDCPQIIYALSEIIDRPTPYIREDRKGILAPMMQAIIQKVYATERTKWPQLAELLWQSVEGHHVQMYFMNEEDQAAAELIGAAGIIPELPETGDYLTVIDANLAGAKSNLFVETSGEIDVRDITDGRVRKQVELTYRNTHPPSNCNLEAGQLCLNGMLNDWTRWYVPKGVEVEEVLGLEEDYRVDTSHEEFDIIEGIFRVSPLGQTKVRITYTVPYQGESDAYMLRMQKQGGTDDFPYVVTTPWGQSEFILDKDRDIVVE